LSELRDRLIVTPAAVRTQPTLVLTMSERISSRAAVTCRMDSSILCFDINMFAYRMWAIE
jgi:hypothetical protein